MLIKLWSEAFVESIKEYYETGEIIIVDGWTIENTIKGKFGSFCFFVSGMLLILPFAILGTIIQIPIYIIGKVILGIYKIIVEKVDQ